MIRSSSHCIPPKSKIVVVCLRTRRLKVNKEPKYSFCNKRYPLSKILQNSLPLIDFFENMMKKTKQNSSYQL